MPQSIFSMTSRRRPTTAWIAIAIGMALSACKKPPSTSTPSASSASSTTVASASEPGPGGGPCATYANRLCEKAGADSATCQSVKTATDLMPPAACNAGLKDIEFSVKKLAQAGKSCEELVEKLCTAIGKETQSCQLVTSQTAKFGPEKCKMMLEHSAEVINELKQMEAASKPLSADLQAAIAAAAPSSFGPAGAKVQIVEFSDFQCPFCSQAANVVHQIREKYGDKVRFTFRHFPLPMHPNAHEASEAALAAGTQGKFWEFHDRLFKNQQKLDRPSLEQQAKEAGLDLAKFKKALDEHRFAADVDSDMKLGEKVQVNGTPSMFVNGQRVANPTSFEAVAGMIEAALSGKAPG